MKISNKNKKILIWVVIIFIVLIILYNFNTYFLKENFAPKYKKVFVVKKKVNVPKKTPIKNIKTTLTLI